MIIRKRILALLLLTGLLRLISEAACADYTEGYFEYTVGDHCIEITGYFGDEAETAVPAQIAGYPVCVIRGGAFAEAETLSVIHLPDCVMEIEEGAFRDGQTVVYEEAESAATETVQTNDPHTEETEVQTAAGEWSVSVTEPLKSDSMQPVSESEEIPADPGSEELELDSGYEAAEAALNSAPQETAQNEEKSGIREDRGESEAEAEKTAAAEEPENAQTAGQNRTVRGAKPALLIAALAGMGALLSVIRIYGHSRRTGK